MTSVFVGVDVGQSGVRAGVVDAAGRLLGHAVEDDPVRVELTPAGRRAEHDARRWVAAMHRTVRTALAACGQVSVECIAVGALGPTPILVDDALRPLAPAVLYRLDNRSQAERHELEQAASLPAGSLSNDHALPTVHWWLREQPELQAAWVLDAAGFLVASLTGEPVMDTVTCEEYYQVPGLALHRLLPPRIPGNQIAGHVTPQAAERSGLAVGTPVLASSIDSFVDIYAAGLRGAGDAVLLCGSTGVVAVGLPAMSRGLGLACGHLGQGQVVMDWTGSSGAAVQWLRDLLTADPELDRQVAHLSPGAGGVRVVSHLAPAANGTFAGLIGGLSLTTTPAQLMRAMIDSVAIELARLGWAFQEADLGTGTWRAWGGGFRDPVLAQAITNALGRPVAIPPSIGNIPGAAELARQVTLDDTPLAAEQLLHPDPAQHQTYRQLADEIDALTPKEHTG